jgi:hypothetical protein
MRSLHVLVEEPDDLLGIMSEPVIAVVEPPRRALDLHQFLVVT